LKGATDFSLLHSIQISSGDYPARYLISTRTSFPEGKVAKV